MSALPDNDGPTNATRAEWAQAALDAFADACHMHGEDDETVLSDLLCDLHHLFGADAFAAQLERGRWHYAQEVPAVGLFGGFADPYPSLAEARRRTGYWHWVRHDKVPDAAPDALAEEDD